MPNYELVLINIKIKIGKIIEDNFTYKRWILFSNCKSYWREWGQEGGQSQERKGDREKGWTKKMGKKWEVNS